MGKHVTTILMMFLAVPVHAAVVAIQDDDFHAIIDWSIQENGFCYRTDCVAKASDIPSGQAFFVLHGDYLTKDQYVEFTFPLPVGSVSLSATAAGQVTMTALNLLDAVLGTASVPGVPADQWASNVLSITTPGISKLRLSGDFAAIDDLTFGLLTEDFEGYGLLGLPYLVSQTATHMPGILVPDGPQLLTSGATIWTSNTLCISELGAPCLPVPEPAGILSGVLMLLGFWRRP